MANLDRGQQPLILSCGVNSLSHAWNKLPQVTAMILDMYKVRVSLFSRHIRSYFTLLILPVEALRRHPQANWIPRSKHTS